MPAHTKVAGTWRELKRMHTRVGGNWREVQKAYVKVSGSWREIFTNAFYEAVLTVGKAEFGSIYGYQAFQNSIFQGFGSISNSTLLNTGTTIYMRDLLWSSGGELRLETGQGGPLAPPDFAFDYVEIAGARFLKANATVSVVSAENEDRRLYRWTGTANPFGTTIGAAKSIRIG